MTDERMPDGKPIHRFSMGDMIANKLHWQETHSWEEIPCPDCPPEREHLIVVCAVCGWPAALDGHCRCDD
jgi:hypothetical protein